MEKGGHWQLKGPWSFLPKPSGFAGGKTTMIRYKTRLRLREAAHTPGTDLKQIAAIDEVIHEQKL